MLISSNIQYCDDNVLLEGYMAYQANSSNIKSPTVILCHAWRGRDAFICEKVNQIATLGYVGFAIDMYGKDVIGNSKKENAILKKPFNDDRNLLNRRLLQGYHQICSMLQVDINQLVVVGFGFGGLCALELARSGVNLQGAVSIYGHYDLSPSPFEKTIKAKILILHGYNDPVSTMQELSEFQTKLTLTKVDWQTHLYGNTFHAFATPTANDAASGILYNPISAKRAWQAVESFLGELFFKV